ncbi:MAG: type 4a pilus biogenesis protein PilO [Candidatus Omnitrophica bacterium]|nr:type 4a pilus biogenesis protein PilO [Candidatus Omnitrophota bacterium]
MDLNALLTKYKNVLINAAVILLAIFIAFNFIYKKQQANIAILEESKKTEEKKNLVLDSISSLEKKIDAYSRLLVKKDATSVINSITEMARASGIRIISIRPALEQQRSDYIRSTFDLSVKADTYQALGRFVSNMENYSDVYTVDSVDIHTDTQGEGLLINLKISSIAYK